MPTTKKEVKVEEVKKTTAKKPAAKKATTVKKTEAKKAPAKKTVAKTATKKITPAKKTVAKKATVKVTGDKYYGTGKRKNAIARVWLTKGTGKVTVNGVDGKSFLKRDILWVIMNQPFAAIEMEGKFDVVATTTGGGLSGQAGALRHGISKALSAYSEDFRVILRKDDFLTRDSRVVERKKPGRKKARKGRTYRKR